MSVTVEDLKKEIKDYNLRVITDGDSTVVQRAIEKAVVWAQAKVTAASGSFDEGKEVNRLIVIKRALYELYSYAENESVAQDKREDALELLKAVYGDAIDAGDGERSPIPTGAVNSGKARSNSEWP